MDRKSVTNVGVSQFFRILLPMKKILLSWAVLFSALSLHAQEARISTSMRKAMEAAGDTSSAIYLRARSISEGLGDPLGPGDPSPHS
jgi:hypothetical protein